MNYYHWSRLGFSVAIFAGYCILILASRFTKFYALHRWHGCLALLVVGATLWVIGHRLARQRAAAARSNADAQGEDDEPSGPFFLADPSYWGVMLAVLGATLPLIVPLEKTPPPMAVVQARSPAAPTNAPLPETNLIVAVAKPVRPPYPRLKLGGVTINPPRSSALINRQTCFVGETIEGTKLVAIEPGGVLVEFLGEQRFLQMER